MIEMYAVVAFTLIAVGVLIGLLIVFAVGIHREERRRSIDQPSPGPSALGLRTVLAAQVHPMARQDLAFNGPKHGNRW